MATIKKDWWKEDVTESLCDECTDSDFFYDTIEEDFKNEALVKLEQKLYAFLEKDNIFPDDLYFEEADDKLKLVLKIKGDWKDNHLHAERLVEKFVEENNLVILSCTSIQTDKKAEADNYSAYHVWWLEENKKVNEDVIEETYSDEELDKLKGKTFNLQKIQNIYRRQKYGQTKLFAHTRCTNCGREKRVFLSNLVKDPDKYGSCVCSDVNVKSKLDNINDLFKGNKTLSNNTSGHTGVTYVKTSKGEIYDKWRAYIEVDGKRTYLGDFDSKTAAIRARKKAAEKGLKWYREHRNEFMKNYRNKSKRYRKNKKD